MITLLEKWMRDKEVVVVIRGEELFLWDSMDFSMTEDSVLSLGTENVITGDWLENELWRQTAGMTELFEIKHRAWKGRGKQKNKPLKNCN